MHSTRGRANVLRMAMAGRLGEAGLDEHGIKEVLDLCLECRACKSECPVGVDMGRYKSEYLAWQWARHGTPLRARVLGHVHDLARWGSRLAPLSNLLASSGFGRWVNEKLLQIDARRVPPAFSRDTWQEWFAGRTEKAPDVYFFNDTFTNYYNPHIGIAAAEVLASGGISCGLAPNVCCGRGLISQGLLGEAQAGARRNTELLYGLAASGATFLFCEPSCLSAIRDDVPALLRGEEQRKAEEVAKAALLWEEFVEREAAGGRLKLNLNQGPEEIILHGHCHQKSMGLLAPAQALLSRVPGAKLTTLDSGCCGMAGSFGYGKEHYEVSKAIGERRLLPAARSLKAGQVLVAAGVSCRHQVHDFTGKQASHPAVLLRSLLASL
ncbi:MAG: oxidoreductase, partial [Acidobacteriia bacterium]|nr:oxidoreductase [Terriglobia bacterium]